MVLNPSVPAKTVPEFIVYAKANPGKINMASAGIGTPTHVFGEMFMMMAGVDLLHVPYRGGFMPDLLGGQVQVVFGPISQLVEHIQTGKLRGLAVTTATRQAVLPDIPTIGEFVPGYEASVYAFDLIELDGDDLRRNPLIVRKTTLGSLLSRAALGLRLNEHLEADGPDVFHHACKLGLEGIVSKRKDSRYRSGHSPDWVKSKNPDAPAVKRLAEEEWGRWSAGKPRRSSR
jgi:hypothetical protein